MSRRLALSAMGYREEKPGRWLKPIGFHLFTFAEEHNEWANWFMDATGKIALWDTHKKLTDDYEEALFQIKEWEAYSEISKAAPNRSRFELRPDLTVDM